MPQPYSSVHPIKADSAAMATLQGQLKGREAELSVVSEKLCVAEVECNEARKSAQEAAAKTQGLTERVTSLEEVSPPGGAVILSIVILINRDFDRS